MKSRILSVLFLATGLLCAQQGARLLIVAHDNYYPLVQELADWKTGRGMLTRVVPLSAIGGTPAQIRAYVQNAWNTWNPRPEFLLIVGYGGQVPAYNYSGSIYTDNYYADMTGDYRAELKYGRLPCKTARQCSVMVAKTLEYERNPYPGDSLWFRRGLTIVREDYDDDDTIYWNNAHLAMNYMRQNGFAGFDTLSRGQGHNATDAQNSVSAGKSFVVYRGVATVNWYTPFAVNPGATSNGHRLPVVLSTTCMTVTLAPNESMVGDGWLRAGSVASPRGAVAFFGNTRAAADVAAKRGAVCRGFMRAYFADSVATLGEAALAGKLQLDNEFHDPLEYQGFNLLGDPTLLYWTARPFAVAVEHDSVAPPGSGTFAVLVRRAGLPLRNCVVCLRKGTEVYKWGLTDAGGRVELDIEPLTPGEMAVTVTGRNVLPNQGTVQIASGDVAVSAIVAPGTFIPPGGIAPRVRLRNCGLNPAGFPVLVRITNDAGIMVFRDSVGVSNLPAGETLTVSFADWQAENGLYLVTCSTRLCPDVNPANDTLSRWVGVVTHDVGVSQVIEPAESTWVGDTLEPVVRVCNFGSVPETFRVYWSVFSLDGLDYADSLTVMVPAGESSLVEFSRWIPEQAGEFECKSFTALRTDIRPENDTGFMPLLILVHTGVSEKPMSAQGRKTDLRLLANPVKGKAVFEVSLARPTQVSLTILDASGRRISTLLHRDQAQGSIPIVWSGTDQAGRPVARGLYFARLVTSEETICRKIVLR